MPSTPARGDGAARCAVLYARVSSKDQEREGFSIPAQLELLRSYAGANGFTILREFVDVETAKQAGRTGFGEMIALLRRERPIPVVLVEKTDRLYRNLKDWVTIDALGVEIHFVKEGVVLSPESRSSEKFMHGIKVLMAKNFIDNLSEETRKGMLEKARHGLWPSYAPLGYLNVDGPGGKRTIMPDPEVAPLIKDIYQRYASGKYSLKDVAGMARADGLAYRKSGADVPISTVHKILGNRIYSGDFDFDGVTYLGTYEPIVSRKLWNQVQNILDLRHKRNTRTRRFAFSGLITCGHCGRAMVGELKKGRYVYYHCCGCSRRYTREEVFEAKFTELIAGIVIKEWMLDDLPATISQIHEKQARQHAAAAARLHRECRRLQDRIDAMYVDKLDGKIDAGFYERKVAEWRAEQAELTRQIEEHEKVKPGPITDIRSLAERAATLFAQQSAHEKRKLLDCIIAGCVWNGGELRVEWREWSKLALLEKDAA